MEELDCECNKTKKMLICSGLVIAGVSVLAMAAYCLIKKMN